MNIYKVCFPFKGDYHFINLTADQIANDVLGHGDDISDFIYENKENYLDEIIYVKGIKYSVTFSLYDTKKFNVYKWTEDGDGSIVEENIPWRILKVISEDGEVLYNVVDYI